MFTKTLIASSIALLLAIIGIFSWLPATEIENRVATSGQPMKVARYYWPGMYWIEIADKKGWFKEAGLNIEIIDSNQDYYSSLLDVVNGKIDSNGFSLFDVMSFNAAGADLVMVINCDNSSGAEAIVAKPAITAIADLEGKNIGVDIGSYTEYILDTVLKRNGVMPGKVNKVQLAGEQAADNYKTNKIDAVATWEPVVSKTIKQWHGRKLFDTSEIPGISPNGQVFRRSFIKERPGDVQAYINVWHKTTLFMQKNPKEAYAIITGIYNIPPGEALSFARLDKLLNLRDNITAFSYGAGFESLHGAARHINNFLIDKGTIEKPMNSTKFIDASLIRTLMHSLQQEAL